MPTQSQALSVSFLLKLPAFAVFIIIKLVKINNDFIWHKHDDTDEAFIVIEGKMFIELRNETVEINEGEMIVIPKGTEHKPFSKKETKVMIIEPKGVTNTDNKRDKLTAPNNTWI